MDNFDLKKWSIIGHQKVISTLRNIILNQRIPHAFLFSGASGIGKTLVAQNFINSIQCLSKACPCGVCNSCKSIKNNTHPDIIYYDEGESLKIKDIRKLKHSLSLGSSVSPYKICLLGRIERLTIEATNALLKVLEEPSGKTIIILTTENHEKLLPTIVSRCVLFNFLPPAYQEIRNYFSTYKTKKIESDLLERIILNSGNRPGIIFKYLGNKDKLEEIKNIEESFEKMLSNDNSYKKFDQATNLAKKEKFELKEIFEVWKSYFRNIMFCKLELMQAKKNIFPEATLKRYSLQKISKNISEINKASILLSKNINKKLLIENLVTNL